jgi:hypothetical protein
MSCQRCKSARILSVSGHASDCFGWSLGNRSDNGYLPSDFGIGGGDDIEIDLCLDCGQLQGKWPMSKTNLEKPMEPEDFDAGTYTLKQMQELLDNIRENYGENAKLCFNAGRNNITLEVG